MLKITNALLGRPMRVDEPISELGISSYDKLRESIKEGDKEMALRLADYVQIEGKGLHDFYCDWSYALLTWIADNYGEDKLPDVLRYSKEKTGIAFYDQVKGLKTVKQLAQWFAEQMRAHRSGPGESGNFKIIEEKDKIVMEFDPCGSGGRMRRGSPVDKSGSRLGQPYALGKTKKEYPWSWFMKDVPYYCLHCSIWHEIIPIEAKGTPTKITKYCHDPKVPCKFIFYKNPEKVPAKYYKRVGLEKKKGK